MKKITLLTLLLVCSISFGQISVLGTANSVGEKTNVNQKVTLIQPDAVTTKAATTLEMGLSSYVAPAEGSIGVDSSSIANERSVLALCSSPLLEINQDFTDTCMANISQGDIAQSFQPVETESAGAGFQFLSPPTAGTDLTLTLWDDLPPNGGVALTSGTTVADGVADWLDVFWDVTTVVPGDTYFIVVTGSADACLNGSLSDVYPGGNVYANPGYGSFPGFDFTFRTYSCDAGAGCAIVSDCNLTDSTPDDATSPDIWDRPFAGGTCCSGGGPVSYDLYGPFTVDTAGNYTFTNTYTLSLIHI